MLNRIIDAIKFFLTQYPDNETEILIKDKNISLF